MRRSPVVLAALVLLAACPLTARCQDKSILYNVVVDNLTTRVLNTPEKQGRYVTVQFRVKRAGTEDLVTDVTDEFVVYEDGRKVDKLEIDRPRTGPLTTILAIDISGSMDKSEKMTQAKKAANLFLDKLHAKADCGLILFNHDMVRPTLPPVRDPLRFTEHREQVRAAINAAKPRGGTAYIDATAEAVQMLEGVPGRKAIVVMTDGVDLNSKNKLQEVIDLARTAEIPVYTLGVGEPGKNDPVTTVLALDHSGSMSAKADRADKLGKIGALKEAAARFTDMIRPGARTTLLPFSDKPGKPEPFTDSKEQLKRSVEALTAKGETALFDAVYDALMTLKADTAETQREGKDVGRRAVVAMTDGIDNKSRRRVGEVIKLAKETSTPLYLLGLGTRNQIDEATMRRMAEETGGKYYHAQNQQKLVEVFESLSIQLHDDGIDEVSLKKLAEETGGKYYLARNISDLQLMYERVAEELQNTYKVTYKSQRVHDGTASGVDISIERGGMLISNVAKDTFTRHGVVLAQMHPGVYLLLLVLLGGLLALPGSVRRMVKTVGGG